MTYLLRKFSFPKWEDCLTANPGEYEADAITGCTRTRDNELSVWESDSTDFEKEDVKDLIVALAISLDRPDTIDLLWLNETWLTDKKLIIKKKTAETKFKRVNSRHKDITKLDHIKLGIVAEHIATQAKDKSLRKRIEKNDIILMVIEYLSKTDTFSIEELKPKWQDAIGKKLKQIAN